MNPMVSVPRRRAVTTFAVYLSLLVSCGDSEGGQQGKDAGADGSSSMCGNGRIDQGERCDTAIPDGDDGACPSECDREDACLPAALVGAGCTAECVASPISVCVPGDGCCPTGCDGNADDDCSSLCGNGVVEPGETCDPPSACPSSCDHVDPCEQGSVVGNADDCNALCEYHTVTLCEKWATDGCCPSECNANSDADCGATCGNGVIELPEQCDDQNIVSGDGCDASCLSELPVSAFRAYDIDLLDPHVFVEIDPVGCVDITNPTSESGGYSVNEQFELRNGSDTDQDGMFDMSIMAVFRPLHLQSGATGVVDIVSGICDATGIPPHCTPDTVSVPGIGIYTTHWAGSCMIPDPSLLTPLPGGYDPAVPGVVAPCFLAIAHNVMLDVQGVLLPWTYAEYSGEYTGDPDDPLGDVIMRAFITEYDAETNYIGSGLPLIGSRSVASLLPGGQGNCAPFSDLDQGPDGQGGVTTGWWFHYLLRAGPVDFTDL